MSQSRANSLNNSSLNVDLSDHSNESSPLHPELRNIKLQVLISELSNKLDNAYYQIEQQNELTDKLKQTITLYEKTLNILNREIELLKDSMKAYNVLLNTLSEGVSPGQSKPEQSSNIFN